MDPFPLPKWPCSCFHSQSSTWLLLVNQIIHWQPLCSRFQSRRGHKLTCVSCLVYSWPQAARGGAWRSGTTCLEHTWRRSTCTWSRAALAHCYGPAPTPKATSGAKASALLSAHSPTRSALSAILFFCFLGLFVCGFCILGWFVCSGRAEVLCFSVISGRWCWGRKQTLISLATCEFGERTWSWHVVWYCLFSGLEITFCCCFMGQMKDHCDPHCEAIVKGPLLHIV